MRIKTFGRQSLNIWQWLFGFLRLIVRQYREKQLQKSAASLTYVTLFATVPLLTVTYSMFSIIPAFQSLGDELQAMFFEHFLPSSERDFGAYLKQFSNEARNLTVFGVAFLAVSAFLMLRNIEQNFNAIWGVARGRRGVANFLLYWAILSLGPLLLGIALTMSTYLTSFRLIVGTYDSLGVFELIFRLVPTVLTWVAFTLLFVAVPNCKVRLPHALLGGFLTTIGFEGLKTAFAMVVANSSFTLIYGAFAAVPLFLLWINLMWTLVLAGAVFVYTISAYQINLQVRHFSDFTASLLVLWRCYQATVTGGVVSESELLKLGLSSEQWMRVSRALVKHHVITTDYQGCYLVCRNLDQLPLSELADIVDVPHFLPSDSRELDDLPWAAEAKRYLGQLDEVNKAYLERSVTSLFMDQKIINNEPEHRIEHHKM